jgi:hypothetical protein
VTRGGEKKSDIPDEAVDEKIRCEVGHERFSLEVSRSVCKRGCNAAVAPLRRSSGHIGLARDERFYSYWVPGLIELISPIGFDLERIAYG